MFWVENGRIRGCCRLRKVVEDGMKRMWERMVCRSGESGEVEGAEIENIGSDAPYVKNEAELCSNPLSRHK
jgi:hypothetical protein